MGNPFHLHNIINSNANANDIVGAVSRMAIETEPNQSRWTVPKEIPCLAPTDLLASMKVDPIRMTMLVIDAEGSDAGIVHEFLKLAAFAPTLIQFEKLSDIPGVFSSEEVQVLQELI